MQANFIFSLFLLSLHISVRSLWAIVRFLSGSVNRRDILYEIERIWRCFKKSCALHSLLCCICLNPSMQSRRRRKKRSNAFIESENRCCYSLEANLANSTRCTSSALSISFLVERLMAKSKWGDNTAEWWNGFRNAYIYIHRRIKWHHRN